MPVFLSHRKSDSAVAVAIDDRLKLHGITTYLDVLDPEFQTAESVTSQVLKNPEPCTHLLAVVSMGTAGSWWVQFEIGVATRGEKRIATCKVSTVALPEYLAIWPILSTETDVDKFARRYLSDGVIVEKGRRLTEARASNIQTPVDFHRLLKQDLGQR